jgi:hypothetical protein
MHRRRLCASEESEEEMKDGNEICFACGKTKQHHPGVALRCPLLPIGTSFFTPSGRVSVPKELIEAVRELMEKHDAMTSKPNVVTIADYEQVRFTMRAMLDQIGGKDGGE